MDPTASGSHSAGNGGDDDGEGAANLGTWLDPVGNSFGSAYTHYWAP